MGKLIKPVKWKLLAEHLAQNATPTSGLRPLHQDTIGLAWNAKIWRFDDQQDLPIFTADFSWTQWSHSEEGVAWRNRWAPSVKTKRKKDKDRGSIEAAAEQALSAHARTTELAGETRFGR